MSKEAMKLALEAFGEIEWSNNSQWQSDRAKVAITALREALAEQPAQDNTYSYAKNLAEAMFKRHFASDEHYASGRIVWGVNDTVIGILTQIDNMVSDMVRRPAQQQEPVACQHNRYSVDVQEQTGYCIDCGAEGRMRFVVGDTPPASKPWVGLTHQERNVIRGKYWIAMSDDVFDDIEAKLKEKNK